MVVTAVLLRRRALAWVPSCAAAVILITSGGVASAHSPTGKAFLQINGVDVLASSNPYSNTDEAPELYTVQQQLTFVAKPNVIGAPANSSFLWQWGDGTPATHGPRAVHAFTRTGVQTVILQVDAPGPPQGYLTVDTIELSVFDKHPRPKESSSAKANLMALSLIAGVLAIGIGVLRRIHKVRK